MGHPFKDNGHHNLHDHHYEVYKKLKTKSIPLSLNDEVLVPGMLFAILIVMTMEMQMDVARKLIGYRDKKIPEYALKHLISNLESKSSEAHHRRHQRS